jgi:hypothetical protein
VCVHDTQLVGSTSPAARERGLEVRVLRPPSVKTRATMAAEWKAPAAPVPRVDTQTLQPIDIAVNVERPFR